MDKGGTSTWLYDFAGNLTRKTDPTGVVETRSYDPMGRLATVSDPASGLMTYTYDPDGNKLTEKDAANAITSFTYDAANRLTKVTDALGQDRVVTLDPQDNVTAVTDANGHTTTFTYDLLKRAVRRSNPLGQQWAFTYDPRDNRVASLDPKGQTQSFAYDALSRLTQVATPGNTLAYSYDPEGNLTAANDNDSALSFLYDPLNRVVTANTLAASGAQPVTALSYLYDARHNLLSIADSAGGTTRHAWDKADRLKDVQTAAGDHIGLAYDLAGRMTGMTFPNGVVTTATFDTGGRVSALTSVGSAGPLSAYGHQYDARGDISSITELNQAKSYSYDALQRLKLGGTAAAPERYSYDPEGNRTSSHLSTTYITDAANRLLEDDTFRYAYDANGNLAVKIEKVTAAATTYRYDAQDQLVGVDLPDGTLARYRFDALGRRIEKQVGPVATRYVYDRFAILLEFDLSNLLTTRFSHGDQNSSGTGIGPLARGRFKNGSPNTSPSSSLLTELHKFTPKIQRIDSMLAMEHGGHRYFYGVDRSNSIRWLTNSSGAIVNLHDYDAYGHEVATLLGVPQPYRYTSREFDTESGLMNYRARAHAVSLGRFLQEDPIWFGSTDLNLYRYVRNNPVRYADPTGKDATEYMTMVKKGRDVVGDHIPMTRAIQCTLMGVANALAQANRGEIAGYTGEERVANCVLDAYSPDPVEYGLKWAGKAEAAEWAGFSGGIWALVKNEEPIEYFAH